MSRLLSLTLFLSFAIIIVGSTHYYIWARLVHDVGFPAPWDAILTGLVVALGLSIPVGMAVSRLGTGAVTRIFTHIVFIWMGVFFFLLCILAATDAVRLLTWAALQFSPQETAPDAVRRLFLSRLAASGAAGLAAGAALVALNTVRRGPEVVRVPVVLSRLPKALHGFKVAQISDLHVGRLLGRTYVEQVVARTNALTPDLVVITGDLVDGRVQDLREATALLAGLKAPQGIFFVTGNHEYYSGVQDWLAELERLGIRVLRNERVAVGQAGQTFDLAGIDDYTAHSFGNGHGADLPRALAGRDTERELLLLAHQPRAIFEAAEHGVGLMLSGHTHGGQLWPFGYIVRLVQPYVQGLARHGATQIYVNRGTGFWGPPMRLGAPPELTLLELQSAPASA